MGRTLGFRHSAVGHLGHVRDIPSIPGTLGWEGQGDFRHSGTLGSCLGCSQHSRDSGMGRTLGFRHSAVGCSGHVCDVPSIPGTLGWEGQWDFRYSAVGHLGHVLDVPSIPGTLGWEGQLDFRHSAVGHSGHVLDVPSIPGTPGWEGQLDFRYSAVGHSGHVLDVPSDMSWMSQGRIQHVIITGGCTVILAHAQVVGGGAVRTLVRTLQRELLGRCLPCGGALNLHNHLG